VLRFSNRAILREREAVIAAIKEAIRQAAGGEITPSP
jgi:hypothetical protein